jgi:hypothetical protein
MKGAEKEGSAIATIVGAVTYVAVFAVEAEVLALREKYTVHSIVAAPSALGKQKLDALQNKRAEMRVRESVWLSAVQFNRYVAIRHVAP